MTDEQKVQRDEGSSPSTPAKKTGNDIWAFVGKASVALGVFATGLGLWSNLNPKGPRLVAYCDSDELTELHAIAQFEHERAAGQLRKAQEEEESKKKTPKRKATEIGREFERIFGDSPSQIQILTYSNGAKLPLDPLRDQFFVSCRIMNGGSEPADDVVLDVRAEPRHLIVNGKVIERSEISKSIKLGTIRPGPQASVGMISSDYSDYFFTQSVHLSYRGGTGHVHLGKWVYGFDRAVVEFLNIIKVAWFLIVLIVILFGLYIWLAIKNQSKPPKLTE